MPETLQERDDWRIFVCQPTYGDAVRPESSRAFHNGTSRKNGPTWGRCDKADLSRSLLANCFNVLWTHALNMLEAGEPIRYFAMLHSDIAPDDGWLDVLYEDITSSGADLVSAVVPIKDGRGVTSTAVDLDGDEWRVRRRLTMRELMRDAVPDVFTAKDLELPDGAALLANTGCWIADLRSPIFRETDEHGNLKVFFTIRDKVVRVVKDGRTSWEPSVFSEDWEFSRLLHKAGGKIACTKRVRLKHFGSIPYPNQTPWGDFACDMNLGEHFNYTPLGEADPVKHSPPCDQVRDPYWVSNEYPDVDGWLKDAEGRYLAKLTKKKKVLEIGAYMGRSTIWMAKEAEVVHVVDTFSSYGQDTYGDFKNNIGCHAVRQKVVIERGRSESVLPGLVDSAKAINGFDVVFIDGDHSAAATRIDARNASRLLADDGVLVFHDSNQIGVKQVISELTEALDFETVDRVETLTVIRPRITDKNQSLLAKWIGLEDPASLLTQSV